VSAPGLSPSAAIALRGVSKAFPIYAKPADRLKEAAVPKLRRALRRLGLPVAERSYATLFQALQPLDLDVARGETVGIIGRNGSGKSTLLQLVSGTLTPTTGEMRVEGRVAALLELGSGFNPEYTGRQNVFLNASVLGLSRGETEARLPGILAFADIGEFVDQPVKTYSSGMAMRLAFAVVTHVDADILVIDEAIAVGDAYFQQKCLRWLRGFQKCGTLLFCGHDPGVILSICDRALWLDRGTLRMAGPAPEVVEAYNAFNYAEAAGLPPEAVRPRRSAPDAAGFGNGDARIVEVSLRHRDGMPVGVLAGGETVTLRVVAEALRPVPSPLIGFLLRDRLGLSAFGDNTHLTYAARPLAAGPGQRVEAEFDFVFPRLRTDRYALTVSIASGTQDDHVQLDWRHEVLLVPVQSPMPDFGMVYVAPERIALSVRDSAARSFPPDVTNCGTV